MTIFTIFTGLQHLEFEMTSSHYIILENQSVLCHSNVWHVVSLVITILTITNSQQAEVRSPSTRTPVNNYSIETKCTLTLNTFEKCSKLYKQSKLVHRQ